MMQGKVAGKGKESEQDQDKYGRKTSHIGTTRRVPVEGEFINVYDVFEI